MKKHEIGIMWLFTLAWVNHVLYAADIIKAESFGLLLFFLIFYFVLLVMIWDEEDQKEVV